MIRTLRGLQTMAIALAVCGCTDPEGPRPGWPEGAFERAAGEAEVEWRDTARPWIIGHRGTGQEDDTEPFPENSLPGMLHAIETEGAVGVEIDVMLTRDLEVVIMHDPRLERTTLCMGCVTDRTLAEVSECLLKSTMGGLRPPSLAEALAALAALPVEPLIMVDTKLAPMDGCPLPTSTEDEHAIVLGRRVGEALRDSGMAHVAAVQGRVPPLLEAMREAAPEALAILAETELDVGVDVASQHGFAGVAVGLEKLHEQGVLGARDAGLLVDTFVVDAPVDISSAVYFGADILETDRVPDLLEAFE